MTKLTIKTGAEIEIMAEGGRRLAEIRKRIVEAVRPGVTTLELERIADKLIVKAGGQASFKMVPGYSWATCINVNSVVVHGIPDNYKIKSGDKVGIDVGFFYKGRHTDTSITVLANPKPQASSPKNIRFLEVGRLALKKAIGKARVGNRVWDLSEVMQTTVEQAGYSVVRALTGHGVGKKLHEEPAIPCFVVGERKYSVELKAGMVVAIEVMYNEGSSEVKYVNDDGWTIGTADGKISGLFEDTVAVTNQGPVVLTQR